MSEPSRRSFLRLGGLVSGGLILPWAGNAALSLAEPAVAADIAVVPTAFPVSEDLVRFRSMLREHAHWRLDATIAARRAGNLRDNELANEVERHCDRYEAHAARMWARPVRTWGDIAELAEIAWEAAPKQEPHNIEVYEPLSLPARLATSGAQARFGFRGGSGTHVTDFYLAASAALIEGVLTMADGERYDPHAEFAYRWERYQMQRR